MQQSRKRKTLPTIKYLKKEDLFCIIILKIESVINNYKLNNINEFLNENFYDNAAVENNLPARVHKVIHSLYRVERNYR